jgi:hypothetical protein
MLREEIGRFYQFPPSIELNRLPGPAENQSRFVNSNKIISLSTQPLDGIDLVLTVAHLNLQIAMSTCTGDCDLSTFDGAGQILRRKLEAADCSGRTAPNSRTSYRYLGCPTCRRLSRMAGLTFEPSGAHASRQMRDGFSDGLKKRVPRMAPS